MARRVDELRPAARLVFHEGGEKILDRCAACYIEDIGAGEHTALIFNAEHAARLVKARAKLRQALVPHQHQKLGLGQPSGAAGSKTVVPWPGKAAVSARLHHASR